MMLARAPIQKAKARAVKPYDRPSIQPIPRMSFESPRPIHSPWETNQSRANGRAKIGPAEKTHNARDDKWMRICADEHEDERSGDENVDQWIGNYLVLYIVNSYDHQDTEDEKLKSCDNGGNEADGRIKKKDNDKKRAGEKFNQRILPGNLCPASLADAALRGKGKDRYELDPGQSLCTRHAFRPPSYSDACVVAQSQDVQKTADESAKDEGDYEYEVKGHDYLIWPDAVVEICRTLCCTTIRTSKTRTP